VDVKFGNSGIESYKAAGHADRVAGSAGVSRENFAGVYLAHDPPCGAKDNTE
jgi:hypothetical protein